MSKVILICGKICSGKTTYAKSLINSNPAVLLSVDEITILFFGVNGGKGHDIISEKTRKYLFDKSVEIINAGTDVVLDWGFWKQEDREEAISYYKKKNILFEWHYIDVSNDVLLKNLKKRNHEIETGQTLLYYFEEDLAIHFWEEFEPPEKSEMDIWYINQIE